MFLPILLLTTIGCARSFGPEPTEQLVNDTMIETIDLWNREMSIGHTEQYIIEESSSCWNWVLDAEVIFPSTQAEFYSLTNGCAATPNNEYADSCPGTVPSRRLYGVAYPNGRIVIVPITQHSGHGGLTKWQCTLIHETVHLIQFCTRNTSSVDHHSESYWFGILASAGCEF